MEPGDVEDRRVGFEVTGEGGGTALSHCRRLIPQARCPQGDHGHNCTSVIPARTAARNGGHEIQNEKTLHFVVK